MCGVLMLLHSLAVSARGGGWLEAAAAGEQQIQNTRSYDRNITTQQAGQLNFVHFGEGQKGILKIRTGDEVTTRRRTLLFPLPGDAIQFV